VSGDMAVVLFDAIVLVAYTAGTMAVGSKMLMRLVTR